jgi:hypothetical protein
MMTRRFAFFLCFIALSLPLIRSQTPDPAARELIYVDPHGVLRWRTSDVEVAMLGANYCLPSASDYRAAGLVSRDRKKMIDDDMTHFARMGWDALRLSFWGDWECCDREGNLLQNDHLDLLDYLIYRAKSRDLHMLLSPIVTYSSTWPGADDPTAVGFSRYYKRDELGTNPAAIAAQVNYLKQLLNHVNPYTHLALKDEPYICYVELINEPAQHPQDFDGSVSYINALNAAVRSTGCRKVTFFNLSQDFAMAAAIAKSDVDGVSFALYPSGLVAGHQLHGNFLRTAEDYSPMLAPEVAGRPRVVYEYDLPDVMSGYHYPAMVRTFRSVGAQSATMFSYDMLATAPYNLGWQTHCLNLVYTPQKAASAIIASQVMRRIPRYQPVGSYPTNTRFGDFHVSYEENLSELVSPDLFYYSNNTQSRPPEPGKLRRVVGFGSSPVVRYEGAGIYFLDRIREGVWRLEVYPDALQIDDPFARPSKDRLVFRLISRAWPMGIDLPGLGGDFTVTGLNTGNGVATCARDHAFSVQPGVYLLTRDGLGVPADLPDRLPDLPYYLGMREFVCPASPPFPTSVELRDHPTFATGQAVTLKAEVAAAVEPASVTLHVAGKSLPMQRVHGYDYSVVVPPGTLPDGESTFTIGVQEGGTEAEFPAASPVAAHRAPGYSLRIASRGAPVALFAPATDIPFLALSRSGEAQNHVTGAVPGSSPGALAYPFGFPGGALGEDYTASLFVGDRISDRRSDIDRAAAIHIRLKGVSAPSVLRLTLVEKDGAAWSAKIFASTDWKEIDVPISDFHAARSVMLPQAYPGTWSYWLSPPPGRTAINLHDVERLQFSERGSDFGTIASVPPAMTTIAIESVAVSFQAH